MTTESSQHVLGVGFAPADPPTNSSVPWELAAKNGLPCRLVSIWVWPVEGASTREEDSLYFQLRPLPPPFFPLLLAPWHFVFPFVGLVHLTLCQLSLH